MAIGTKYIIKEVLDTETGERSKKFGYRVGRVCFIDGYFLNLGVPLIVEYPNNSCFRTTVIQAISLVNNNLKVITANRIYCFEALKEE